MTKDERLALNKLSKKAFGSSSRWKKKLDRGEVSNLSETLEDGTERKYKGIKYPTQEELVQEMNKYIEEKNKLKVDLNE